MTITTRDELISALANNSTRVLIDKLNLANAGGGQLFSLWRANGQPGPGATPTSAAVLDNTSAGAMAFADQVGGATSYLGWSALSAANASTTWEIHDRLMHMGGLSGTVVTPTAQTVNLDVHANLGTSNLAARIGPSDYSEVSWWLEGYSDTGGTTTNITVNVTYNDGTSGDLTAFATGGFIRGGRVFPLNNLIPAAKSGFYIRDVNSLILSVTTGAAGNFGITATRHLATLPLLHANFTREFDWAQLNLAEVKNDACLALITQCSTSGTGIVRGQVKLAHG